MKSVDGPHAGRGLDSTALRRCCCPCSCNMVRLLCPFYSNKQYQKKFNFALCLLLAVKIGDRDLEAKVDERLLLRFNLCGCADENENLKHLEDGNKASMQGTNVSAK